MSTLKGKSALVTGATSGIGEACARQLAAAGAVVIIHGRNRDRLEQLKEGLSAQGGEVETLCFDTQDRQAVEEAMAELLQRRQIDILINNAGLALGLEPLDEGSVDEWETMIDTNIKGLLYVSRAVMPQMRRRDRGHIINIGSIAGKMTYPGGNVYCATKSAVHTLNEAMNIDLAGTAIRVGNIAPGAVETNFSPTRFGGDRQKADAVYDGYEALTADDIADMALYMLGAPAHVNIQDVLIMPTAQRNPYVLSRDQ